MPAFLGYFLKQTKTVNQFVYAEWLLKDLCLHPDECGFSYLPFVDSITKHNLEVVFGAFASKN
jgi:hypothetical protein